MESNLILLGIAALNAWSAYMAYKTHSLTKQVEVATNSMKDALVTATAKAEHASGFEAGRLTQQAETKILKDEQKP